MFKYLVEWVDQRTVYTEVEAKSESDAKKRVLKGEGKELDWCGSDSPNSEKDIMSVKKGDN